MSGAKNDPAAWRPVDFTTTSVDPPTLEAEVWRKACGWFNNHGMADPDFVESLEFRHTIPHDEIEFRIDAGHDDGLLMRVSWDYDGAIDGVGYYVRKIELEEVA